MKKITFVIFLSIIFSCADNQNRVKNEPALEVTEIKKSEESKKHDLIEEQTEWKEMEDYHMLMAETFHPAEENDFEPIKNKAQELSESAEIWKNAIPPESFKSPELSKKLDLLANESKELADFVTTNPKDELLFEKLSALHDRFHEIMGVCNH